MQRLIMQCVSGWCHYCLRIVSILLHNAALRRHVAWCMVAAVKMQSVLQAVFRCTGEKAMHRYQHLRVTSKALTRRR
jgi:hypothetical protein